MRAQQDIFDDMSTDETRVSDYKLPSPLTFLNGHAVSNAFE